jgi:predicted anti-sigma-YlaC factor YlaD
MKNKLDCGELRDRVTRAVEALHEDRVTGHLEDCAACRGYVARLREARQALRDHHGNVEPDAGFRQRVLTAIPAGPTELMGWAALRLLPAGVALTLVLAWFALQPTPTTTTAEVAAPTDDLLSWVLDAEGGEP